VAGDRGCWRWRTKRCDRPDREIDELVDEGGGVLAFTRIARSLTSRCFEEGYAHLLRSKDATVQGMLAWIGKAVAKGAIGSAKG
jgi:hypothetical protein